MFAPTTGSSESDSLLSVNGVTADYFVSGGLKQGCSGTAIAYEPRKQQQEMALAVADAMEGRHHLVVEAGTGVGKSFAYLVPAIAMAVSRGERVIVSTYTISLQEQLIHKDTPFLKASLGMDFKAVLVKGRSNYLCLRRLSRAFGMGDDLFDKSQNRELAHIQAWSEKTVDGSIQEMKKQPPHAVWQQVCSEYGNCLGKKCGEYQRCFFIQARQDIFEAHLLVVNHHLFFSELAMRLQGGAFLPPYTAVVMDEAHRMEQVASEYLGIRLSHYSFEYWLRQLYVPERNKGILAYLKEGKAALEVSRLRTVVEELFGAITRWARFKEDKRQRTVAEPIDLETDVPERMNIVCGMLKVIVSGQDNDEMKMEINSIRNRGYEMMGELKAFLEQSLEDHVYWVEAEGRRRQTVLHSAPVEVGPILRKGLFDQVPNVVMTSATLAVNDSLDYFQQRIGAEECRGLQVGSPFDYGSQMRVYIPTEMPAPDDREKYLDAVVEQTRHYVSLLQGRTFVLFTSSVMMRSVAQRVQDDLEGQGINLLVQGTGMSRHDILTRFRQPGKHVLHVYLLRFLISL